MSTGRIFLKQGRERLVIAGNPWVFSHALQRVEPAELEPGATVHVCDSSGALLGYGYYNPATTIAVRMLSWGDAFKPDEILDYRIGRAIEFRRRIIPDDTNCYRLVNGEGDGLPGTIVDRYGEVLVVQLLTAGADRMRADLVAILSRLLKPRAIIERSKGAVRKQEGLPDRSGVVAGDPLGEAGTTENGFRIAVDFEHGQKTGYFLDQRENRVRLAAFARGARVLDACCYAGGFALAALRAGAKRVVGVDTSVRSLSWARRNLELNGYPADAIDLVHDEAGKYMAANAGRFDLVVLDPPPLARSIRDAPRAAHLYAELNALALRALAPGGYLMTFSCSVHFRGEDFIQAVRIAQSKARRQMRILGRPGASADHPVLLGHVEGEYLTGLLIRDLA
jgi:23S rRNA (cytosine1962-C5)-methyltransferase